MTENNNTGIGFVGLLTIAFIVLKLTHVITWSWWWILAPIWIAAILVSVGLVITAIILFIVYYRSKKRKKGKTKK